MIYKREKLDKSLIQIPPSANLHNRCWWLWSLGLCILVHCIIMHGNGSKIRPFTWKVSLCSCCMGVRNSWKVRVMYLSHSLCMGRNTPVPLYNRIWTTQYYITSTSVSCVILESVWCSLLAEKLPCLLARFKIKSEWENNRSWHWSYLSVSVAPSAAGYSPSTVWACVRG